MRDVFAVIARAAGRPAPRLAVPWTVAYAAARVADAALRPFGREPQLLVLDEVRAGPPAPRCSTTPRRARELGYVSRSAVASLADAARSALASSQRATQVFCEKPQTTRRRPPAHVSRSWY